MLEARLLEILVSELNYSRLEYYQVKIVETLDITMVVELTPHFLKIIILGSSLVSKIEKIKKNS